MDLFSKEEWIRLKQAERERRLSHAVLAADAGPAKKSSSVPAAQVTAAIALFASRLRVRRWAALPFAGNS